MDFETKCSSFFKNLGQAKEMVLATCSQNRTTARMMSCIVYDGKFYVQTDKELLKYKQLCENPNAALCSGNIQIEGQCGILGHPLDRQNDFFAKLFKKYYLNSFNHYSHMKNEVLVEISPTLITRWFYDNGRPLRFFLDFKNKKAFTEEYNCKG